MSSKKEKLFTKISQGRRNVRIRELVLLMKLHNFDYSRNDDNYMFWHKTIPNIGATAAIPHGRENKVLKPYVDNCIRAIEQAMEVQDE